MFGTQIDDPVSTTTPLKADLIVPSGESTGSPIESILSSWILAPVTIRSALRGIVDRKVAQYAV